MFRLLYLLGFLSGLWMVQLHAQPPLKTPPKQVKTDAIRSAYRREVKRNPTINPPLLPQKAFVVLDPGHGGHDMGTQSILKPRYQEKSLNLITAQFVKTYLQELGYQVKMTREDDTFVSLDKRAQFANQQKPELFVSIHFNASKRFGSRS